MKNAFPRLGRKASTSIGPSTQQPQRRGADMPVIFLSGRRLRRAQKAILAKRIDEQNRQSSKPEASS
jgi:hypothetical protein